MKKVRWFVIAGLVLSLGLAGCSNNNSSNTEQPVSIRMQIAWATDTERGKAIQRIIDIFEKQNENIDVKLVGSSQNNQKLLTQLLSGDAPEVLQIPYRDELSLGSQGAFVDLTKEFHDQKNYYYENIVKLGTVNNKLYGFPWLGSSIQLVYNKTMFEEAGITSPPDTWEELYEIAKKLTKDTNGDGKIDQYGIGLVGKQHPDIAWLVSMFFNQAGANLVEKEDGNYQVALNSQEGKQALDYYKKMVDEVSPPDTANKDGGGVMADFLNGEVAMEFQGPWGITDIWQNGSPFEVAAAPTPAGPAGRASDLGLYMLSIPADIEKEKEEAAKRLISFLASKKAQEMILTGEKGKDGKYYPLRLPMRKDLASTDYYKKHPEFLVFMEGLEYPSISSPTDSWARVQEEVYQSELNKLVTGKSAENVLRTIEEKGNKLIEQ
ncbi:ABC transporter substrate-binding protein [Fictibacillus terranigra]|uniref:Sugar ABC transporter substrate-binding protein n=1 Tax=Fictibacillus terranigra TaxID=3058424 RepID=A0ABT8EDG5_9BACL|nr:sugar ABC transporter substrate-binding protein [Fictibacillus sp. CENA-BCM004]MDN4075983.1 sugar ABC transporter substrate-binding protein [Fictibacillus sp. CENA-BCM004]